MTTHPLVLFIILFLSVSLTANGDSVDSDIKKLNKEIKTLQNKAHDYKNQQSRIEKKLADIEVDISQTISNIRNIEKDINSLNIAIKQLSEKEKTLAVDIEKQKQYIQKQILAAYQLGNSQKIKLLLNQEDPETISRTLQYYHYFNLAREKEINHYLDLLTDVKTTKIKSQEKNTALKQQQQKLLAEKKHLDKNRVNRESAIKKIQADLKTTQQKIKNREKEREELEALLKSVRESITSIVIPGDTQPFIKMKDKLHWPVKNKKIVNQFNTKRDDSSLLWQGLLLESKEGEEVRAIYNGRIVFSDWFKGYGLLTIIDHGDGYLSLYAHNQSLLKEAGEWVNSDTIIATVGNSGGNNKTALYFEIRLDGKPINPSLWCQ